MALTNVVNQIRSVLTLALIIVGLSNAAGSTALRSPVEKYVKFNNKFGSYRMRSKYVLEKKSGSFLGSSKKSPILCIHGFGGNADQFRKNIPVFAEQGHDSHAIDLLGYGYSDKPNPKQYEVNEMYNFENWADQTCDYIQNQIKKPSILVCNSVGGVVGLQAAKQRPDLVKGLVLIDISMRMLHIKKQKPWEKPVVARLQKFLRETDVGKNFFQRVAQPKTLKNILNSAYGYDKFSGKSVDDETVDIVLKPGLEPGAAEVFLDFISYSGGPLPEELLPQVKCPVSFLWGEKDAWEPINMGRTLYGIPGKYECVKEFVPLPNSGHCPMDQSPDLVNQEILRFISQYC